MAQSARFTPRIAHLAALAGQPSTLDGRAACPCPAAAGRHAEAVAAAPTCAARTPLASRHGTRRKSLGQGMTEYIVIVALVGVAAIGVYSFLGQSIRGATSGIALELAGEDASKGIAEAKKAADKAVNTAKKKATLKNYNDDNHD